MAAGHRVVLMSGLPASGKTTTALRLHARLGGVLIRQCDVYARLGIDLRAWARRTAGFTRDVDAYERVRDAAYVVMLDELRAALAQGARRVVIDAGPRGVDRSSSGAAATTRRKSAGASPRARRDARPRGHSRRHRKRFSYRGVGTSAPSSQRNGFVTFRP